MNTVHPTRKAHVYDFDFQTAVKRHLDIVTAVSIVEFNGETILLQVNEAVYNPSVDHSLLYEFQIRDYVVTVNSVAKKHGREQKMVIGEVVIPCGIRNALFYFKNRVPTDDKIEKLKPVVLTQGGYLGTHAEMRAG